MSNSLPCVLSNIDANRDVFNSDLEAAIFVNIKERDETASIVSSLLNSKTQQRDLGARARIIVEQEFNEKDKMREMKNLLIEND
jgi:hypothetical protein